MSDDVCLICLYIVCHCNSVICQFNSDCSECKRLRLVMQRDCCLPCIGAVCDVAGCLCERRQDESNERSWTGHMPHWDMHPRCLESSARYV